MVQQSMQSLKNTQLVCHCLGLGSSLKKKKNSYSVPPAIIYWYPLPFTSTAAVVEHFATVYNYNSSDHHSLSLSKVLDFYFIF